MAQTIPATTPAAQPVPMWQADSGVKREVEGALQSAQAHQPQVPTLVGTMFPTYPQEATASAQQEQK